MSTNNTPTLDPADAARMLVSQLRYWVEAADKATAAFADGVAKNGPAYAIRWAAETVHHEARGTSARRCLDVVGDDADPELVAAVVGGMVADITFSLINRHDTPTSSSMFSNAVAVAEGDGRADFVRSARPLVDMLNEALS